MKKIIILCSLCAAICCLCTQCKNPSNQEPDKKIEQTVLDFYDYKNGTYWVYQDTFGTIDSTWVSDYTNSLTCDGSSTKAICVENIRYFINSSRTTDRIAADVYPNFNKNYTGCMFLIVNASGTSQYGWYLGYENNIFSNQGEIVEHFDTFTVNGETFNDVYFMKSSIYTDARILMIAKNKGILMKGRLDNASMLIRYNIVR